MLNLLTVNKLLRSIIHYYCLVSRHDLMFSHFVTLTYKQRDNLERFCAKYFVLYSVLR